MLENSPEATGELPDGKLNPQEDQIEIAVIANQETGRVDLSFDSPVSWLAMRPDDAVDLARALIRSAQQIKPVVIEVPLQ